MYNSVNEMAAAARYDMTVREELMNQHEQLILKTASRASYRYISKSDDEWSIALCAFSDAVDKYSQEKGDFIPFARTLVKRSLIDYHRSMASHLSEVSVSPFVLEGTDEDGELSGEEKSVYLTVVDQSCALADRSLKDEIISANEALKSYGFRFYDLVSCSPQQEKTKQICAEAVHFVLSDPQVKKKLVGQHKLPIHTIVSGTGISKKLLDRYRKYIIMAVVIIDGNYPQLSEYLTFIGKGSQHK